MTRISRRGSDLGSCSQNVASFVPGKKHELRFINTAIRNPFSAWNYGFKQSTNHKRYQSKLSAAATIGTLSWSIMVHTPWPLLALWYCSLLLAIFALIPSNQHCALVDSTSEPWNMSKICSRCFSALNGNEMFQLPGSRTHQVGNATSLSEAEDVEAATVMDSHRWACLTVGEYTWYTSSNARWCLCLGPG